MLINSRNKENGTLIFASPRSIGNTKDYWRWLLIVGRWIERSRQRRNLAKLDDLLLDDIGITKLAAAKEIGKPFWR